MKLQKLSTREKRCINHLRSLEDNFDDEGSKAPTNETINRAVEYAPKLKEFVLKQTKVKLGDTIYSQGPDASVDLLWEKKGEYSFLANVSADNKKQPTYYGKFPGGIVLEKN